MKLCLACFILFCVILSHFAQAPVHAESGSRIAEIKKYVENGTVMLNDESGKALVSINPEKQFVPASIIKVLTAAITLDLLREDFRFKTEYCLNDDSGLIIRGYGDPFLISDEIRLLAQDIKRNNIKQIRGLLFDRSFFVGDLAIPGLSSTSNPYDALNGALYVNFNTIYVGKNSSGKIYSAEEETPLTPLAKSRAVYFTPGSRERINLSSDRTVCNQYAAELIYTIFQEQGISITENAFGEAMVDDARACCTYYNSRQLPEVLKGLLEYSNNFIANQIFLYIGAQKKSPPATMEKGKEAFMEYIRNNLNIPEGDLTMVEGSGISRSNRITGNAMLSIMERFKPHAGLLAAKDGHPVKSGTLKDVSNYAGYIKTEKGLRSFVIILNQKKNYRDTIFKLLAAHP